MRDGFAAVEEKRNFVAAKNPRERLVIIFQTANENGTVTETVAGTVVMDEFQDFARGENGLGFGIGAVGDADGVIFRSAEHRLGKFRFEPSRCSALRCVEWARPAFFKCGQRGILREAASFRLARKHFNFNFAAWQVFNPLAAS